jgi:hypothetical protein
LTNEPTHPAESTDPTASNAAPVPASAPGGAGFPPPPRRGGLPRWAWFLIGGGALLMIVIIVVVALVVNAVLGAVTSADRADQPTTAPTAAATSPGTGTPTPTTAAGAGVTSLDEHVELGAPFWSFPVVDGWEITVFDQKGLNQATNTELNCLFTTSQNRQAPYDLAATSDRSDTEASLDALIQEMVKVGATVVGDNSSTEVAVGVGQAGQSLEFATGRVEYVNPQDGGTYINDIAARAMPKSDAYLYLVVSCPAAVVDAGQSPFAELVDSSAVVFE